MTIWAWTVVAVFGLLTVGCAIFSLRLAWAAHRDDDGAREDDVLDRQWAAARSRARERKTADAERRPRAVLRDVEAG